MPSLIIGNGIYGRGVFSETRFTKGSLIESCPILPLPKGRIVTQGSTFVSTPDEVQSDLHLQLARYAFEWSESLCVIALGYGSIYNHSYLPNIIAKPDFEKGVINFYALEDIECGVELVHNYGYDPLSRKNNESIESRVDALLLPVEQLARQKRLENEARISEYEGTELARLSLEIARLRTEVERELAKPWQHQDEKAVASLSCQLSHLGQRYWTAQRDDYETLFSKVP